MTTGTKPAVPPGPGPGIAAVAKGAIVAPESKPDVPEPMSSLTGCWSAQHLERLFRQCFFESHRTLLVGGAPEPLYTPAAGDEPARIFYTRDYFRSALHEIAHWCVAGPARRMLEDYGYWYAPDGRSAEQQREFEVVEVYPQALELIFCAACGHDFRVSADNLNGPPLDLAAFQDAVRRKAEALLNQGLSERARLWAESLAMHYRGSRQLQPQWLEQVFRVWQ